MSSSIGTGANRALAVGLVGPLPPPSGGMANQCRQLAQLLGQEGLAVTLIRVNPPYRPRWVSELKGIRALFRLVPYLVDLWRAARHVDVFHVLANSGWAWHLFAAPAIVIAKLRGVPVIVNYRGGNAETFLARAPWWVLGSIRSAESLVVPSDFLRDVFGRFGASARKIPNIVDLRRFAPPGERPATTTPHLIVTRNLEPIYDIPTALHAFTRVRKRVPGVRMTVAGTGPERDALERLCRALDLGEAVTFAGGIDNDRIGALYASADVMVNPSRVDNMPISILEAFASGVPVVSTNVGGVPFIAEDGRTALLVPPGDPDAMSNAIVRILLDRALARSLSEAGLGEVQAYSWTRIRDLWLGEYRRVAGARYSPAGTA